MDDFEKNVLYKVNEAEQLKQEMTDEEIMDEIFSPVKPDNAEEDIAGYLNMICNRIEDLTGEVHYLVHIFAEINGFKE